MRSIREELIMNLFITLYGTRGVLFEFEHMKRKHKSYNLLIVKLLDKPVELRIKHYSCKDQGLGV